MKTQIIINKADTLDWLDGDSELAEKYASQIAKLTGYSVELGQPTGMRSHEIVTDGDEDAVEYIYQWACDRAANDWSWAD